MLPLDQEPFYAGEYGVGLRHNAGKDLTAATRIILTVTPPKGDAYVVEDATVGAVDVKTKRHGLFKAGEYVVYITKVNEFELEGRYYLKWEFEFGAGKKLKPQLQLLDVES